MRLKEDRFGWENIMAGIFEYILGPEHVMEWSSVLDLAKDDVHKNVVLRELQKVHYISMEACGGPVCT